MAGQRTDDPVLDQVEFDANDLHCEVARATVRQLLQDLDAVRDVQFLGCAATVTYNPLGITKEQVCSVIREIGYHATEIEVDV